MLLRDVAVIQGRLEERLSYGIITEKRQGWEIHAENRTVAVARRLILCGGNETQLPQGVGLITCGMTRKLTRRSDITMWLTALFWFADLTLFLPFSVASVRY